MSSPETAGIGSRPPPGPNPIAAWKKRAAWHRRTALLPLAYLAAAAVAAPLAARGVVNGWLVLHLVLLGAVTNAILVWSAHFAAAILRSLAPERRSSEAIRLAALNAGVVVVLTAGGAGSPWLGVAGAAVVFGAVAAHLLALAAMVRRALPARFTIIVRYYLAAGLALLSGIPAGAWMLVIPEDRRPRILVFHAQVNVLGWVALTVLGTLLTLWPTVLRVRMPDHAEERASRGLRWCGAGLLILAVGAALWLRPAMAIGLAAFTVGAIVVLWPAAASFRQRPSASFAALSITAGICWMLVAIGWDSWALLTARTAAAAAGRFDLLSAAIAAGFAAQVVAGALAYLLPMAAGGGPAIVRANADRMGTFGWQRVSAANLGLIGVLCPMPHAIRWCGAALLAASWIWFLATAASTASKRHHEAI